MTKAADISIHAVSPELIEVAGATAVIPSAQAHPPDINHVRRPIKTDPLFILIVLVIKSISLSLIDKKGVLLPIRGKNAFVQPTAPHCATDRLIKFLYSKPQRRQGAERKRSLPAPRQTLTIVI